MINRALVALSAFVFVLGLSTPSPAAAAQQCESLTVLKLPNVTILSATSVPAGSFTLPNSGSTQPGVTVPAFCRVAGVVAPQVKFEVWMPADWNRKFLTVGNGGLAGTISYGAMVKPLQRGFATASTDTGHTGNGQEASWALGHFEEIIDFAHRSVHVTAQAAKAIIQASYGAEPGHSYFSGCSQGGAQALMEAQRYPLDFEGIIAGDPANYWTHHYVGGHLWVATALEGSTSPGRL